MNLRPIGRLWKLKLRDRIFVLKLFAIVRRQTCKQMQTSKIMVPKEEWTKYGRRRICVCPEVSEGLAGKGSLELNECIEVPAGTFRGVSSRQSARCTTPREKRVRAWKTNWLSLLGAYSLIGRTVSWENSFPIKTLPALTYWMDIMPTPTSKIILKFGNRSVKIARNFWERRIMKKGKKKNHIVLLNIKNAMKFLWA